LRVAEAAAWAQEGERAGCCVSPGRFATSSFTFAADSLALLLDVASGLLDEKLTVEKPGGGGAQLRR